MLKAKPERPLQIRIALALLLAQLVAGLFESVLMPTPVPPGLPSWFAPVVLGITFLLLGAVLAYIATGRWWAFVLFVAMFLLGLPFSVPHMKGYFITEPTRFWAFVVHTLAQSVAIGILLTRPSRAWFSACRVARAT